MSYPENGVDTKFVDAGSQLSIDIALGRKRKTTENEDSDEEEVSTAPPVHDIYRQRQQKKVKAT